MQQLVVAAALVAFPSVALGEGHARLRWTAPATCPSETEFLASVDQEIGTTLDAQPDPGSFDVTVYEPAPGDWRVSVISHTTDGDSETTLSGSSCDVVASSAALVVALAIPHALAPAAEATSTPLPSSPRSSRWILGAVVGGDLGSLPHVGPLTRVDVSFNPGWLRVGIGAFASPTERAVLERVPGMVADIGLWGFATRVCARVGMDACTGVEIGAVHGASDSRSAGSLWAAAVLGAARTWHLAGGWGVVTELDAVVPMVRPSFYLAGRMLFQPSAVAGRLLVGFEWRIP